ncbi:MAG: FAD binding domain-containing protein [Nannocystaceae bacterium]|nr:FAD binding domain-containing protein [Nannocystaceae bacterium]
MTAMLYTRPSTVAGVLDELRRGAVVVSGGTVICKQLDGVDRIVDLGGVASLREIHGAQDGGQLLVGAACTAEQLASSHHLQPFAALSDAAAALGNPQIRRRASIGGNVVLCEQVTSDLYPPLLALNARVQMAASDPASESAPSEVALHDVTDPGWWHGKLIISFALDRPRWSSFRRYAWRQASGKPIVNVAAATTDGEDSTRVFVGGLSAVPQRVHGPTDPTIQRLAPSDYIARVVREGVSSVLKEVEAQCS